MKNKLIVTVSGWGGNEITRYAEVNVKNGVWTPANLREKELVIRAIHRFPEIASRVWSKLHLSNDIVGTMALNNAGDIKGFYRFVDFCDKCVTNNGNGLVATERMIAPLIYFGMRNGTIPTSNGSMLKLLEQNPDFVAWIKNFCEKTNSDSYFYKKDGTKKNWRSTIVRQTSLGKTILGAVGALSPDGTFNTGKGFCSAIRKLYKF